MSSTQKLDDRQAMLAWEKAYALEQKKALARISAMTQGPMGWVFSFVAVDLENLGVGGWQDLRHEVAAFAAFGHYLIEHSDGTGPVIGSRHKWERGWENSEKTGQPEWDTLSIEEILERKALPWPPTVCRLQELCRNSLEKFTRDKRVSLLLPEGTVHITSTRTWIEAQKGEDAFVGHFIELLKSEHSHLKQCLECQTFFLGGRTDQRFCTVRCQSRHNMRMYRSAAQEKLKKGKKKKSFKPQAQPKRKPKRSSR
jgi:hypothetical protein